MTIATTDSGNSNSSQNENSRFSELMEKLKGNKISNSQLREEVFNILLDDATESPSTGNYYTFEYDPKFADRLKEWDQYPLVYAMEYKKDNLIGANIHYIRGTNSRLKALNNKRFPKRTLRQYIPKNADRIFFEIKEDEVQLLSTLPIEKFHRNR
ncbi:gp2 [Eurybiavirus PHM1]|uniref:Gp2 n=1 Tax=Prochlorococcus phage P-HM1 TaxID=445700 RepID=E3SMJ5_9CAUD|nr:DNA end protector [Prochlorococcus phage P-HM1]ADO98638.1 gp2 [Prochlorococcus phage P-HM1]